MKKPKGKGPEEPEGLVVRVHLGAEDQERISRIMERMPEISSREEALLSALREATKPKLIIRRAESSPSGAVRRHLDYRVIAKSHEIPTVPAPTKAKG